MKTGRLPEILARFVERRPWWIIIVVIVLTAAAIPGITMLKTESGLSTFVSPRSERFQDNMRYEEQFGDEPITVLLTGQLDDVFSTQNLAVLSEFEQDFSQDQRYHAILSQISVLELAVAEATQSELALWDEIARAQDAAANAARDAAAAMGLGLEEQEQAAEEARGQVLQEFQSQLDQLQEIGEPSLENPVFVAAVLYGTDGSINPAMAPLIPDDQHTLIIVTPVGNMDDEEALQAIRDIETFFLTHPLDDVSATVIGDAKIIESISTNMGNDMAIMLGISVAVMTLIMILLFRVRWRLLSLLMVGVGVLWTFGLMGYASVPLSMATMAVLPILIGLGIDYSIQFHNRYQEEVTRSSSVAEAISTSLVRMFPVAGIALIATIIGFITLYLSQVPMVRDFGLMLAVGVILNFIVALFFLHSVVYLADRRVSIAKLSRAAAVASGRIERILSRMARIAVKNPLPIFLIALIFGVAGGVVDHWLPTNTDYEQLMPQDIAELQEVRELRDILGYGGELRFMVEADDVTASDVLRWLKTYQDNEIALHPELISVTSPATLISEAAGGIIPKRQQIDQILANTPPLYVERVISGDRQTASVAFNIRHMELEQINELLGLMKQNAQPPEGVHISPVGTLALGAATVDAVVSTRLIMNVLCLGAIFAVLLLVYRRFPRALLIALSLGLVLGWASLDMYIAGIPLNPLTAVLGVIIIGINTEFMVLLTSRYEEEKRKGESPHNAMILALSKMGRAIVTTALTTLGGFGVLIASHFIMVRDFGIVTVIGLFLCLVCTMTVMPPLIVWLDEQLKKRLSK